MRVAGAAIVLASARVAALAGHDLAWTWWSPLAYLWQDAATLLAFAAIDRGCARRPRLAWTAYALFVLYIAVTVPPLRVMSTPMTWTMWRGAGGALADSIWLYATAANLAWMAAVVIGSLTALVVRERPIAMPLMAVPAIVVLAGPAAVTRVDTHGLERNAWSALVASSFRVAPKRQVRAGQADLRRPRDSDAAPPTEDLARFRGVAAGRNVILVSLESTAAQYLGLYGAAPDVAPTLTTLAGSGIVFENAYAVYPESIKGLYSILCAAYPAFDSDAASSAAGPCPSIAETLAKRGYRTALFHSGRFAYLGMDAVIRGRGFQALEDAGDIGGHRESSFGVDDRSTADRVLEWIDALPRGQRFFVTYLPIAGHHPYDTPEPGPFPDRDEFGRYRNALRYSDEILGWLTRGLEARGLDRDTLWIVLGDHGEAFGQHDTNFGHTFQLYEENVHVPFIVAAPGAIPRQVRARRVISLVDTAPTLLDLLGTPPSSQRGSPARSALDAEPRMALFFADYSMGLLGLRDGPRKYIYELESGRSRLFELDRDRGERHNRAADRAEDVAWYSQRLRAWIAAQ